MILVASTIAKAPLMSSVASIISKAPLSVLSYPHEASVVSSANHDLQSDGGLRLLKTHCNLVSITQYLIQKVVMSNKAPRSLFIPKCHGKQPTHSRRPPMIPPPYAQSSTLNSTPRFCNSHFAFPYPGHPVIRARQGEFPTLIPTGVDEDSIDFSLNGQIRVSHYTVWSKQ